MAADAEQPDVPPAVAPDNPPIAVVCQVRACTGKYLPTPNPFIWRCDVDKNCRHRAYLIEGSWLYKCAEFTAVQLKKEKLGPAEPEASASAAAGRDCAQPEEAAASAGNGQPELAEEEVIGETGEIQISGEEDEAPPKAAGVVRAASVDKQILQLTTVQRDELVGKLLRGQDPLGYQKRLREAVAAASSEIPREDDADCFTPRRGKRSRSYVWKYMFLRRSEGGKVWHCRGCGAFGPYHRTTANLIYHLHNKHDLTLELDKKISKGEASTDTVFVSDPWGEAKTRSISQKIALWICKDKHPPHLVDMPGWKRLMFDLFDGRYRPAVRTTILTHRQQFLTKRP